MSTKSVPTAVQRCFDLNKNPRVKVLFKEDGNAERAMARLEQMRAVLPDNVPKTYRIVRINGKTFGYLMQRIDGQTISEVLVSGEIPNIESQLFQILDKLEKARILHGDLHDENLLLERSSRRLLLIDPDTQVKFYDGLNIDRSDALDMLSFMAFCRERAREIKTLSDAVSRRVRESTLNPNDGEDDRRETLDRIVASTVRGLPKNIRRKLYYGLAEGELMSQFADVLEHVLINVPGDVFNRKESDDATIVSSDVAEWLRTGRRSDSADTLV